MPVYIPSNTSVQYSAAANPPFLDKIAFTIDHIHLGSTTLPSTYNVVEYLVAREIPVTVFAWCTGNDCEIEKNEIEKMYDLDNNLVTIGVHSLDRAQPPQAHADNFAKISNIIEEITDQKPIIMSHHGHGAGPVPGVNYNNVKYIRGVGNVWAAGAIDPLNTPVIDYKSSQPPIIENSIERCFSEATKMNKADLVPTLFFHSNELVDDPLYDQNLKKSKFDHFVNAVVHRNIEAVSYLEAMTKSFMDVSVERRFRVSASEKVTLRRAQVNYIIEDSSGTVVETAENSHTKLFTLPVGDYTVKAKVDGELKCSKLFTLTPAGGVHVIVYV